ncbi:hypothetical protein BU26DRAFT_505683 [Trematosphaeria pertusa]|uniref:Uncharacterized protein n=1 Tax=Trematosphaeria pertusa TaxID=390896 RepID=A0A6A6IEG9_9PLEO|nr:uncharacterized protein BU26DRAFT_505683 [Trematosphaeria pertusa]KAF2247903.1 hypothetical protein BU26DRAFT_505683 [Trematosphaeria pertusa]
MKFTTTLALLSTLALTNARVLYVRQANAQTFAGALGGVEATPVLDSGNADRPFDVAGDTFVNIGAALQRSCDQQFNGCANLANGGAADFSTSDCQAQKDECSAASAGAAARRYRLRK